MTIYEPYLEKSTKSVFRFEGLQDYSAEDGEESVRNFIESGKLPFISSETEWWQGIKRKNESGVKTYRVRLVRSPLNDYTKMEIALHRMSAEYSGEDIRIIEQGIFDKVFTKSIPDFYLIDDKYAFPMKYGLKGKFMGDNIVSGNKVEEYVLYKDLLLKNSVPAHEWK
jgi:hypothetical protein